MDAPLSAPTDVAAQGEHGAGASDGSAALDGLAPSRRLARLRQDLLDAGYALCTQKAELLTDYFAPASARERDTAPVVLFAEALAHVLANVELRIYPHELIVGNLSSQRIGAPIHPDFGGVMIWGEVRGLGGRAVNPLRTTPEQIRRLEEEIFPLWSERSVMARAPQLSEDPDLAATLMQGKLFVLTQFAGISHVTPDYPAVLARGFTGLLQEVEAARARATTPERAAFYEAAAIVSRAAMDFAARWSRHCTAEAEREPDAERRRELLQLAAILARVPAHPARTFYEAVQSVFLTHVIVHQESFQHGVSFGRVDQYLYPYYRRDLDAGALTHAEALEIVGCFLAKCAELVPLFTAMATEYFSGLSSASGLTLGGTDADGNDASNELSTLFLAAYDQMRLRQPNLHARVHPRSAPAFLRQAYHLVKRGGGMPAFFNDAAIVPALETIGIAHDDACNYSIVGCVEWGVPGKSFPAAGAGFLSLPAVLDRTLHTRNCASMNELLAGFRSDLEAVVAAAVAGNNAIERAHALCRPTPLLSVLVDGCVARGLDVTAGGAIYNTAGFQGVGIADVADSLAAIEQVVFTEERVTLPALLEAIDADFAGHVALRDHVLNKVPKYGNDAGRAEHWARTVGEMYAAVVRRHESPRGGRYAPGFWTMTTHIGFGARLGALPSGRRAGQPLSDGLSPANGCDRLGPTASMMAVTHAAGAHVANGYALNEKLDPWLLAGEAGTAVIDGLTRGYFGAGGMQVQYNVLDPAVLLEAKRHPERYRDLVVRISGYSAYFNDLTEAMKDELIARTLHGAGPACRDGERAT